MSETNIHLPQAPTQPMQQQPSLPHLPKHIVAVSGLVTDPKSGRVLLLRSPDRGWEFPGGQVEQGESLTDALAREVREETGVEVTVGALVGVYSNVRSSVVGFGFLCQWTGVGELTTSDESLEVEWMARDEALARVTYPPFRDRLQDMLDFDRRRRSGGKGNGIVYRAYSFAAHSHGESEYVIHEERRESSSVHE